MCTAPVAKEQLPDHLVSLVPDKFAVWRWFVLRAPGFPVHMVMKLADPDCAASADRVLEAERSLAFVRSAAIADVNARLDALSQSRGPGFEELLSTLRALKAGKRPRKSPGPPFDQICAAETAHRACNAEFDAIFDAALARQSAILSDIARDPLFQEAVTWQNRAAFENAISPFAQERAAGKRFKKRRHQEELVAMYLQRYTLKNDTIGFFGPVAWGVFGSDGPAITIDNGPALVRERRVYFEEWGIEEVASRLSSIEGMRRWIAPRLVPHVRIARGMVHAPHMRPRPIDPLTEAVLEHCTGETPAYRIPGLVRKNPVLQTVRDAQIEYLLHALADAGVIWWRWSVSMEVNPEIGLRHAIESIEDRLPRERALAVLDRLESRRRDVASSAGAMPGLAKALAALDQEFYEITGKAATRNPGSTYASRMLVYEDCRRDLNIRISDKLFQPVLPALSLVLNSVRWFVRSMVNAYESAIESAYDKTAKDIGASEVPATLFWEKVQPVLTDLPPQAAAVERLFHEKWAAILNFNLNAREMHFHSSQLHLLVEAAFPPIDSSLCGPRYFCPDLMLAAPDLDTIERGEACYVLGELHLAANTLSSNLFVEQHPDQRALSNAVAWDHPRPQVWIISSRGSDKITLRTLPGLIQPHDFLVLHSRDTVAPTNFRAHPISSLVVRRGAAGLIVTTHSRKYSFGAMEAFAVPIVNLLINKAQFIPVLRHSPQIKIDSLVISRESWSVPVGELKFAFEREERQRYLGARRWALASGLPSTFFVKVPTEVKPVSVHLDSPIYIEILCKMIRCLESVKGAAAEARFSETLPAPHETWLMDARGNRYTAELRFAILDLHGRSHAYSGSRTQDLQQINPRGTQSHDHARQ